MDKWQCPTECPYQADDSLRQKYSSWINRYKMFLMVLFAVGLMGFSIWVDEKRLPKTQEITLGLLGLIASLKEPELIKEFAQSKTGIK